MKEIVKCQYCTNEMVFEPGEDIRICDACGRWMQRPKRGDWERMQDLVKCQYCGNAMVFEPGEDIHTCEACGHLIQRTKRGDWEKKPPEQPYEPKKSHERQYELKKLPNCPYCETGELIVREGSSHVYCDDCGKTVEICWFTKEERRLVQAVDEARIASEHAQQAVREAAARFAQTKGEIERLAREQAEANLRTVEANIQSMRREQQSALAGKLQRLFERGEMAQRAGRFEEAIRHYQQLLVQSDHDEAEVHWRIVLCRYGVEYVREQQSNSFLPTITHMVVDKVGDDLDFQAALRSASDDVVREFYRAEGERLDKILAKYRRIIAQGNPYDVFISVKQGDKHGNPTQDSITGLNLYHELRKRGLRVFNSRESLQGIAGLDYEPYIMAALMQAKVMIVVSSQAEYINSSWLKNEWRRFRWLQENDGKERRLVPFLIGGMTTEDIPADMGAVQAITNMDTDPMAQLNRMMDDVFGAQLSPKPDPVSPPKPEPEEDEYDEFEYDEEDYYYTNPARWKRRLKRIALSIISLAMSAALTAAVLLPPWRNGRSVADQILQGLQEDYPQLYGKLFGKNGSDPETEDVAGKSRELQLYVNGTLATEGSVGVAEREFLVQWQADGDMNTFSYCLQDEWGTVHIPWMQTKSTSATLSLKEDVPWGTKATLTIRALSPENVSLNQLTAQAELVFYFKPDAGAAMSVGGENDPVPRSALTPEPTIAPTPEPTARPTATPTPAPITHVKATRTSFIHARDDETTLVVGELKEGDFIRFEGTKRTGVNGYIWYMVEHNDKYGWISSEWTELARSSEVPTDREFDYSCTIEYNDCTSFFYWDDYTGELELYEEGTYGDDWGYDPWEGEVEQSVLTSGNVNLRSGPGKEYTSLCTVPADTYLTYYNEYSIDDRGVMWYSVSYRGQDGWVSSQYATLE